MDPHDHIPPLFTTLTSEVSTDVPSGPVADGALDDVLEAPDDASDASPAPVTPLRPATRRKAPVTLFEIGVVYRKNSRYYLAVSERMLITFKSGQLQEIRPYARYDVVRSISVEELCGKWGITLDHLDEVTARYLAPSAEGVKPRPRGSRRQRAADELAWRCLRTIRLLAG
jgi:hypothetical protein